MVNPLTMMRSCYHAFQKLIHLTQRRHTIKACAVHVTQNDADHSNEADAVETAYCARWLTRADDERNVLVEREAQEDLLCDTCMGNNDDIQYQVSMSLMFEAATYPISNIANKLHHNQTWLAAEVNFLWLGRCWRLGWCLYDVFVLVICRIFICDDLWLVKFSFIQLAVAYVVIIGVYVTVSRCKRHVDMVSRWLRCRHDCHFDCSAISDVIGRDITVVVVTWLVRIIE